MPAATDAREIAGLVPMPRLLESLGFAVNERTRRAPCLLHSGSNPTAFAWRYDGRWHCFSCGTGGDKIALVQALRKCSFREAVEFFAEQAGVEFCFRRVSRRELARRGQRRVRAEQAAWRIADEIGRLRRYYTDALHRAEQLQKRVGDELLKVTEEARKNYMWGWLARLAPVCAFFFAAWNIVWDLKAVLLTRFALASPSDRRRFILEGLAP